MERTGKESITPREQLRVCLQKCEAIDFDGLARSLNLDDSLIVDELHRMIEDGEVEVLHPVCVSDLDNGWHARIGRERALEHYRLLRETDDSYLWEQEVTVRLPLGKVFDIRHSEEKKEGQYRSRGKRIDFLKNRFSSRRASSEFAYT